MNPRNPRHPRSIRLDEYPILYPDNHANNTVLSLSRPCVDDPTRYIAECHFGKMVIIEKLCDLLRSAGAKGLKCSIKLGVARFELEERSVMIYASGRVDIRKIRNKDEARAVMGQLTEMIKETLSDISS